KNPDRRTSAGARSFSTDQLDLGAYSDVKAAKLKTYADPDVTARLRALAVKLSNEGSARDAEKIQSLKQAIAEGRFKGDAEIIADRLIEAAKDIFSTRH